MTNRVMAWLIFLVFVGVLAFGLTNREAGHEIELWWRGAVLAFLALVSVTFLWRWTWTRDPAERQRLIDRRGLDIVSWFLKRR